MIDVSQLPAVRAQLERAAAGLPASAAGAVPPDGAPTVRLSRERTFVVAPESRVVTIAPQNRRLIP